MELGFVFFYACEKLMFNIFFQALESSSTWVVEFHDEEEKVTWLKGLIQATYQASV
jgi:hypothetical protein